MLRNRPPSRQARRVLAILSARPTAWLHGYELAKSAGLSSGTLYPLLIRLHERAYLEARWEEPARPGIPPRHVYRLSSTGAALARSLADEIETAVNGAEAVA